MECQAFYLQSKGINEESFDSVGEYLGPQEWCAQRIIRKKYEIENELQERFNQVAGHRAYTICVVKQLKDDQTYIPKVMLQEILEYSRISWRFWMFFERNSRCKIFKNQIEFVETSVLNYCIGRDHDSIFPEGGSGEGSGSSSDYYYLNDDEDLQELTTAGNINTHNDDIFFEEN